MQSAWFWRARRRSHFNQMLNDILKSGLLPKREFIREFSKQGTGAPDGDDNGDEASAALHALD